MEAAMRKIAMRPAGQCRGLAGPGGRAGANKTSFLERLIFAGVTPGEKDRLRQSVVLAADRPGQTMSRASNTAGT